MSSDSGDSVDDDDDEEPQPLKPAEMEAVAVEIDSNLAVVFAAAAADCCLVDDLPLLLYCWVKCSMAKHSKKRKMMMTMTMTMTLLGWRQSAMPDWSAAAGTSTSAAGSTHWRKEALQLPLMLELKMTPKMPMKPQLKWMSPKKKRRTLLLLLATECPPLSPLKDRRKCKRRKGKGETKQSSQSM